MDLVEIEKAIQLMKRYGLTEFEWQNGEAAIRLTQATGQPVVAPVSYQPQTVVPFPMPARKADQNSSDDKEKEKSSKGFELRSPFVGTYYGAPSPGADPFVTVGKRVRKGDTLCIVEAMKLMNEIEAERDGVITKICVDNEQPVEFNQLLFLIEP